MQLAVAPLFDRRIHRELNPEHDRLYAREFGGERNCLLDDVRSAAFERSRVEDGGGMFARFLKSDTLRGTAQASQSCRFGGTLKINCLLIVAASQLTPAGCHFSSCLRPQRHFPPDQRVDGMNRVDQRATRTTWTTAREPGRAEEFGPALFDDPPDLRIGINLPQEGNSRHGVKNVTHGAETDNQESPRRARRLVGYRVDRRRICQFGKENGHQLRLKLFCDLVRAIISVLE